MTELKTLNDLTNEKEMNSYTNDNCKDFKEDLRQEAIKWVKEKHWDKFIGWLRFEKGFSDEDIDNLSQEEFTKLFIEYFFNITDEDLGIIDTDDKKKILELKEDARIALMR